MFESAELGRTLDKATYKKEQPKLREALLEAQFALYESKAFPVIVVIGGVDGAGKGETVNALNAWLDPRHIETNAFREPSDEERDRPPMWRFWRALPPKGKLGIFFGSWYTLPILARVEGRGSEDELEQRVDEVNRFERMLADEGALILKFWFHLSKRDQKKRLKRLEKDPKLRWRVTKSDWQRLKIYDRFRTESEHVLRRTDKAHAPWIVVEGLDERYRTVTVARTILDALNRRLAKPNERSKLLAPRPPAAAGKNVLEGLALAKALDKDQYRKALEKYQGALNLLSRDKKFHKRHAVIAVFEGNDAAGKGGAIRRVTEALDARYYRIVPIAAPTDEERAQPYLWRFWRHLPRCGHFTIFDRSWYGRVLVERVEGFAAERDWRRAYSEINDFEEEMAAYGIIVAKFWLAIGKDEQARRFKEREATGHKRHKLTEEDWRNREKWDLYVQAICDMVDRTSTEVAPWTLVEADDKFHARIKVLKTLCGRIERSL
ncbi:MAG: polyphosphate:AMP phosphotransferase [Alphaproteobacteria bacterium]|nr:polyphosphate:AMP phosphotransferase [Alphaproteobacteria bacterium]